ncbi:MAG: phosphate acyltransferase PlsX [Christensenellales bacterium]
MKILIDTKGGDYSPLELVEGAVLASKQNKTAGFVLFGDKQKIEEILNNEKVDLSRFEVIDSPDEIENTESPTMAIKTKKQSSMVMAFERLKSESDACGMISCGSTGAILTGAILKIGRVPGVSRPSLAPVLPTANGGKVMLIDSGANMDCKPINLCHFALMGSAYMTAMEGIKKPKVALLNVGTEDKKGNDLTHVVFPLLKSLDINFVGNMEARDVLSGKYDVVVCDGFAGNVLLKGLESMAGEIMSELKLAVKNSFKAKIGALFLKDTLKNIKNKFDYNAIGGSIFLGARKIVVKAHGASKRGAILACCEQIEKLIDNNLNQNIEDMIKNAQIDEAAI